MLCPQVASDGKKEKSAFGSFPMTAFSIRGLFLIFKSVDFLNSDLIPTARRSTIRWGYRGRMPPNVIHQTFSD